MGYFQVKILLGSWYPTKRIQRGKKGGGEGVEGRRKEEKGGVRSTNSCIYIGSDKMDKMWRDIILLDMK